MIYLPSYNYETDSKENMFVGDQYSNKPNKNCKCYC